MFKSVIVMITNCIEFLLEEERSEKAENIYKKNCKYFINNVLKPKYNSYKNHICYFTYNIFLNRKLKRFKNIDDVQNLNKTKVNFFFYFYNESFIFKILKNFNNNFSINTSFINFLFFYKKSFGEGAIFIRGLFITFFIDCLVVDDEPLWEPIEWSLVQT